MLPQCAAVVCVAPYWADFLRARGIRNVQVIYNAFDMTEVERARGFDRAECRAEFDLSPDAIGVYAGKAAYEALARFDLNYFGNAWGDLLAQVA